MAATSRGADLTEQHRLEQQQVKQSFLVEFLALWALLDSARLDETGPGWVQAVLRLIPPFRQRSAELSTLYFEEFRAVEVPSAASLRPEPRRIERPRIEVPPPVEFPSNPARPGPRPRANRPAPEVIPEPRRSRVRFDLDESAFKPAPERRTRIEIPDIDWAPSDRAARVSLTVTGPVSQKAKTGRGKPLQKARDESFVEAAGAASRHVLTGGRQSLLTLLEDDAQALGWARVTDGDPCAFCSMLAGRGPVYGSAAAAGFKAHDNCVLPGTIVTGPRTEAAYRRWYEGELVVIVTAAGDELAITPNHPVLTPQGWVDAGLLREGGEIASRAGADLAGLQVPHEHERPALIEDVWRAYSVDGLVSVPVATEDFHGDGVGTQGDVEVVAPHGQFPDVIKTPIGQHLAEAVAGRAGFAAVADSLLALSGSFDGQFRPAHPAHGGMGCRCVHKALVGGETGLVERSGLGKAPALSPGLLKPSLDDRSRHAVLGGERVLVGTGLVVDQELAVRRFDPAGAPPLGASHDAASAKDIAERARIHANYGRALLERLAGGVELSRVADFRRVHYSGHVLNLRTAEGWYDANRIIVSNCACTAEPVYSRQAPWPGRAAEFRRLWGEIVGFAPNNRYSGDEAIRAYRREYERRQRDARRNEVA